MTKDPSEQKYLDNYNPAIYDSPSITVDTVVFSINRKKNENYRKLDDLSLQVLLVKRNEYPEKDKWSLPGGFICIDETPSQAVRRKLSSKVGFQNVYLEQLYTWGDIDRDPRKRILSSSYMSLVCRNEVSIKTGGNAWDAAWFDITLKTVESVQKNGTQTTKMLLSLSSAEKGITFSSEITYQKNMKHNLVEDNICIGKDNPLAFDHVKILTYAVIRLRSRLEYSCIAVHLMPREFSFSDLQRTYECILGKTLIGPNFRRKMKPFVTETEKDTISSNSGYRPAKLFRFNMDKILSEI